MPVPPVALVGRALRRAVDIARAGEAERPPVPAPAALRPVLRFRGLPPTALDVVAGVIDNDEGFRIRVAAALDEHDVGRVAWLWLQRPEGWEREVERVVAELDTNGGATPAPDERDDDRRTKRRLEGAERAAARAAEQVMKLEAELERTRNDLAALRTDHDQLASRHDELQRTAEELAEQRAAAVAELKRVEGVLVRRSDERRDLEKRLAAIESDRAPAPGDADAFDIDAIGGLLARLGRTARTLVDDLDALRASIGLAAEPSPAPADRRAGRARRRRPVPLPGGIADESVEAAAHLVSRAHAMLLVDGYNASMAAWPEAELAEQRARLERLLTNLAARTAGLTVDLVFDGADVGTTAPLGPRRPPGVTVRFTAADIEADDALLELVDRYPLTRPVVVASSDRRVRDGARRRGANVISAAQLLAIARL